MDLFENNKYSKWYNSIIQAAISRNLVLSYSEKHHIIPKSLGGTNQHSNLVTLTAREHYICHMLLTKMTLGRDRAKMIHAAVAFCNWSSSRHDRKIKVNSRTFQKLKEARSGILRSEMSKTENKIKSSNGAKKLWNNDQYKKQASAKRKLLWEDSDYINKMKNRKKFLKKVSILGIEYVSVKDAATQLGIHSTMVSKRCSSDSKKYKQWYYA
jgi:5-methylcytosine-specific restriction endonuclease McrA